MKYFINSLSVFCLFTIAFSCSSPPPPPPQKVTSPANAIINKGINEGLNELNQQLHDTSSILNNALDTIGDVLIDNKKEINTGLNELKKLF